MPSSFSRFLDEAELAKVRDLYLESLAALDAEDDEEPAAEAAASDQSRQTHPGSSSSSTEPASPQAGDGAGAR